MPYIDYPIYYTNNALGHKNRKLNAQTLDLIDFRLLSEQSYGYYVPGRALLDDSYQGAVIPHVPLAPWIPPYSTETERARWGLNASAIFGLQDYLKPGLGIKSLRSNNAEDIALAGTRPVNDYARTITIPPDEFDPYVLNSKRHYTHKIRVVIKVTRDLDPAQPYLLVQRQYFYISQSLPDKTVTVSSSPIPDLPYFVFNFAVSAPGAPGTTSSGTLFRDNEDGSRYELYPGGGSGAGAQFTAILSTSPATLADNSNHTDEIIIDYTLASPSYSSSLTAFDPQYKHITHFDDGIDKVTVKAYLHYTHPDGKKYSYTRTCDLPGGLIYPGKKSYTAEAKTIIDHFIDSRDTPGLVSSSFPLDIPATAASALIFHRANWMLPSAARYNDPFLTEITSGTLNQPFTVFNPEALFPGISFTRSGAKYIGAAGSPSIFANGASPRPRFEGLATFPFVATKGSKGSGGSGAIWVDNDFYAPMVADGGPTTIVLSW